MTKAEFVEAVGQAPVVPVLVIEAVADAAALAEALFSAGATAVEVTLRTDAALASIAAMKAACPSLLVGAGTVLSESDIEASLSSGADFIVTPGVTPSLIDALRACPVPVCPGINTPSEAMTLHDKGFDFQKFFPAGASGGVNYLKSLSGPLSKVSFMPTGGVTEQNMSDYLSLPNVFAVGGSWIAPPSMLSEGDFSSVSQRMTRALEIARSR